MENEIKVMLYRAYMLGFENGASARSYLDADQLWQGQKYCFEEDIKTLVNRTPPEENQNEA